MFMSDAPSSEEIAGKIEFPPGVAQTFIVNPFVAGCKKRLTPVTPNA